MVVHRQPPSRGANAIELVVVVAIVGVVVLVVVMALPRGRETSRLASCQRNLMLIGRAAAQFDTIGGHLPSVPAPMGAGPSPLSAMLGALGLSDFTPLVDPKWRSRRPGGPPPGPTPISSFVCPSDVVPGADATRFPAPLSYRANTGSATDGHNGPFAPGQTISIAAVQTADGADYTAAFAERRLGTGRDMNQAANDYASVSGPIEGSCPAAQAAAWRGNAGSNWSDAGWVSTLYNHSLTPNAKPSCVAENGQQARIGASSYHPRRIHVLLIGGGVKPYTPEVDARVWGRLGSVNDGAAPGP